jgi:hypothetical protein
MSIKNITVMVEPVPPNVTYFKSTEDGQRITPKSMHEDAHYAQLVDELRARTSTKVTLIEDFLRTAPQSRIVILYPHSLGLGFEQSLNECTPELRETLPPRLVLLHAMPGMASDLLVQYRLAASVEYLEYDYWWDLERQSPPYQTICGLASVAQEIGASISPRPPRPRGVDYCCLVGELSERLPALLIRYLEAYVRTVPGIAELDRTFDTLGRAIRAED